MNSTQNHSSAMSAAAQTRRLVFVIGRFGKRRWAGFRRMRSKPSNAAQKTWSDMGKAKRKLDDVRPDLPTQAQVGDRIKLKADRIFEYVQACEQAGYSGFNPDAIRTVTREDKYNPGGGRRLFFDGAPHCFSANDVTLAWNTEEERRAELKRRGWKV